MERKRKKSVSKQEIVINLPEDNLVVNYKHNSYEIRNLNDWTKCIVNVNGKELKLVQRITIITEVKMPTKVILEMAEIVENEVKK